MFIFGDNRGGLWRKVRLCFLEVKQMAHFLIHQALHLGFICILYVWYTDIKYLLKQIGTFSQLCIFH